MMRTYHQHLAALRRTAAAANPGPQGPSPWFPVGSFVMSPYKPGVKVFVSMTPEIYWASKDPRIQAQYGNRDVSVWMALAKLKLWIDDEIMVQGQDPPTIMSLRLQYGYVWTPRADQPPILVPPLESYPGEPSYDPTATATHIVSSVDAAAYKPWPANK